MLGGESRMRWVSWDKSSHSAMPSSYSIQQRCDDNDDQPAAIWRQRGASAREPRLGRRCVSFERRCVSFAQRCVSFRRAPVQVYYALRPFLPHHDGRPTGRIAPQTGRGDTRVERTNKPTNKQTIIQAGGCWNDRHMRKINWQAVTTFFSLDSLE